MSLPIRQSEVVPTQPNATDLNWSRLVVVSAVRKFCNCLKQIDSDEWNCKVQKMSFVSGVFNNNTLFRRCKYYLLLNYFFYDSWCSLDKHLL